MAQEKRVKELPKEEDPDPELLRQLDMMDKWEVVKMMQDLKMFTAANPVPLKEKK